MTSERPKPQPTRRCWPGGRRFAFTIVDDTDHATTARIKPIYDLLHDLGLLSTKTVWVFPTEPGAHYESAETLEDERHRQFVLDLRARGFEIALHGVRGCSSTREVVQAGLERYKEVFGEYPLMHVNHAYNLDNLWWGLARVSRLRRALRLYRGDRRESHGHDPRSSYYWGDLATAHIRYVRGHVFNDLNTLKCDPHMPAPDPHRPGVNAWFSASDGANVQRFNRLLAEENLARLEAEGGLGVVYTHFGTNGFVDANGHVNEEFARRLTQLAARDGWFRPASEILDHLARRRGDHPDSLRPSGWLARQAVVLRKWMRR